jgi:hypothetical protein
MRKIRLIVLLIAVLLASCSGQSSRLTYPLTSTPVHLPATWTPGPSPSIPAAPLVTDTVTPTSTPVHITVTQEGAELNTDANPPATFAGADQWWLRFPNAGLVGAHQTESGDLLLLLNNRRAGVQNPTTALRLNDSGQIIWQAGLEGIKYPSGILQAADGGVLILEPQRIHKITETGEPDWTRVYYYSNLTFQNYLLGPILDVRTAGEGSLILGRRGDLSTLDREGSLLNVDFNNLMTFSNPQGYAGVVQGASYLAEQEGRTVYELSRYSNGHSTWEIRFDFLAFDVTLFPTYTSFGTRDGGVLFLATVPHVLGDGAFSIYAARLDRQGNILWQQIYQGIYEDDFYAAELADGGFLIANTHTFYGSDYSGSFLRLTRLSSSGDLVWDWVYGDGETQIQIRYIFQTQAGDFKLVGQYGYRGENDYGNGIAVLAVDSQGLIPGCRYLAEVPAPKTLNKAPSHRLTPLTPRSTRTGDLTGGEAEEPGFSIITSEIDFSMLCAYPDPALSSQKESEDPAQRIHSFTNQDGLLIGGSQGETWYDAADIADMLKSIKYFRLYNQTSYLGRTGGQLTVSPDNSPCPSQTYLYLDSAEFPSFRIALEGDWNALPRFLSKVSPQMTPSYLDPIRKLLEENGIPDPEIEITSMYRVDLDGDGVDEVLLTANHSTRGLWADGVSQGDYSLLLLRYLQGGQVVTVPLFERYLTMDSSYFIPGEIQVESVLDLNGDGIMEIIARESYQRSSGYLVYDFSSRTSEPVILTFCGE